MRLIRLTVFIFLTFILISCATTQNYEKILGTWIGAHVDTLISVWGPPNNSYQLSNGGAVLEYYNSRTATVGGYTYTQPQTTYHQGNVYTTGPYGNTAYSTYNGSSTTYVQQQTPTYNIQMECKTRFTLNNAGIITNWSYQGNNCVAYAPKDVDNFQPTSSASYEKSDLKKKFESIENATIKSIDTVPVDESKVRESSKKELFVKYDFLNLHSKPSFKSETIGSIFIDTPLKGKLENDNWYYVVTPSGKEGWIAKKWVK